MALVPRQTAGELATRDEAMDMFNSFNEGIIEKNLKEEPGDRTMYTGGLNLPAILLANAPTASGKMKSIFVMLGSFRDVPVAEKDKNGRLRYLKLQNGNVSATHRTINKKYGDDGKTLVKDGNPALSYKEIRANSFFSCYTNASLRTVSNCSVVWLMNVKVSLTNAPDDPWTARDFYTCDTVVAHKMPGDDGQMSQFRSLAEFAHMAFADPTIETLITNDMRDRDDVLMLFVREERTLQRFFMETSTGGVKHPQILKTTFTKTLQQARSEFNPLEDEEEVSQFVLKIYDKNTNAKVTTKRARFVMDGHRWNPENTYKEALQGGTMTKLRLNVNAYSDNVGLFKINDVMLWNNVAETITNAANMLIFVRVDPDVTSRLADNMDRSQDDTDYIHLSTRVLSFAFDYPDILSRCGLLVSAETASMLAESPSTRTYERDTPSFRGKHTKADDALNQKLGSSDITCVNEMVGQRSEIFDDAKFVYRVVIPDKDIASTHGEALASMSAEVGDLFFNKKTAWNNPASRPKTASGSVIDSTHPLSTLKYNHGSVMQGAVMRISRDAIVDPGDFARAQDNFDRLKAGIQYPSPAAAKNAAPMITAPPSPQTDETAASVDDDSAVNMFGDGASNYDDNSVSMFDDSLIADVDIDAVVAAASKKRAATSASSSAQPATKRSRRT